MPDENADKTEATEAEAVDGTVEAEVVEEPRGDEPAAEDEQPEREPEAEAHEPAADAGAAAATSEPKKPKRRLPRALRRKRTKPRREKPAERKPITRLPKPERARGRRQERQGTVVSAAADKTIVVRVDVVKVHPTYKKVIRRSTKLHAHDEANAAKVGDVVRVVEARPLSKLKRWRLQEVVEEAK